MRKLLLLLMLILVAASLNSVLILREGFAPLWANTPGGIILFVTIFFLTFPPEKKLLEFDDGMIAALHVMPSIVAAFLVVPIVLLATSGLHLDSSAGLMVLVNLFMAFRTAKKICVRFWWVLSSCLIFGSTLLFIFSSPNTEMKLGATILGCLILRQIGDLPKRELEGPKKNPA